MYLPDNRKLAVGIAAAVASFLLFDYFHGSEKIGYRRLEAQFGVWALILGELLPIGIVLLAVFYLSKKED